MGMYDSFYANVESKNGSVSFVELQTKELGCEMHQYYIGDRVFHQSMSKSVPCYYVEDNDTFSIVNMYAIIKDGLFVGVQEHPASDEEFKLYSVDENKYRKDEYNKQKEELLGNIDPMFIKELKVHLFNVDNNSFEFFDDMWDISDVWMVIKKSNKTPYYITLAESRKNKEKRAILTDANIIADSDKITILAFFKYNGDFVMGYCNLSNDETDLLNINICSNPVRIFPNVQEVYTVASSDLIQTTGLPVKIYPWTKFNIKLDTLNPKNSFHYVTSLDMIIEILGRYDGYKLVIFKTEIPKGAITLQNKDFDEFLTDKIIITDEIYANQIEAYARKNFDRLAKLKNKYIDRYMIKNKINLDYYNNQDDEHIKIELVLRTKKYDLYTDELPSVRAMVAVCLLQKDTISDEEKEILKILSEDKNPFVRECCSEFNRYNIPYRIKWLVYDIIHFNEYKDFIPFNIR